MPVVSVERYVEQVEDGRKYCGHITIAGTILTFELVFTIPLRELDDNEPVKTPEKIRERFQIAIKRGDELIDLDLDEYGFFFSALVPFAADFYNNGQTRDSNEGILGMAMRGEGGMAEFGASMSIGVTSTDERDFPPELCMVLSQPKFGCVFEP